jgi:hypothetical protein
LNTKIHMAAADNRCAIGFILSGGEASDAKQRAAFIGHPIGRIKDPGGEGPLFLLMDRAYEGGKPDSRRLSEGISPVAPPKKDRKEP